MLGVSTIGTTGGVEWTYQSQAQLRCHVYQSTADERTDHSIRAPASDYKLRFSADPSIKPRHLIFWDDAAIYLQVIGEAKVVRDGEGIPVFWIVYADHLKARQDP